MTWAAVAAGTAAVVGGSMSANASEDAANQAAGAADAAGQAQLTGMRESLAQQMQMFDFSIGANAPQASMGYGALGAMSQMLGMSLPQADSRNYQGELDNYTKQLNELKAKKAKRTSKYNKGQYGFSKEDQAKYRSESNTLNEKIAKMKEKTESAKRGLRQQQLQQNALAQFQPSEGGGPGLQQIQPFSFDFDESQLGQTDAYKFRQEQSLEALDRRLAAGGMRGSGNRYSGILELAQGMASQEYEAEYSRQYGRARDEYSSQFDIYNMFAGMSGMAGVNAQQAVGVGGNMANITAGGYGGYADSIMAGGQAGAAGAMGQNAAFQNTLGQIFQIGGDAGWFDND